MTLQTLEYIQPLDVARFVPSHAPVMTDIRELTQVNRRAITEIIGKIRELCNTPITFEVLLKNIFDAYDLQMSAQQYALIGSTIRSYLSNMYEEKEIFFSFKDNQMIWQTVLEEKDEIKKYIDRC